MQITKLYVRYSFTMPSENNTLIRWTEIEIKINKISDKVILNKLENLLAIFAAASKSIFLPSVF